MGSDSEIVKRKKPMKSDYSPYWNQYLSTLPPDHPHHHAKYGAWGFGDSPEMADELGQLVLDGVKRATAALVKEFEVKGEDIPPVGDVNIILNGAGEPICIIETTEITVKPLNQVDEQFAYDEGEGDRSLAYWKAAHDGYFRRQCDMLGWTFFEDMPATFERFKVIYPVS